MNKIFIIMLIFIGSCVLTSCKTTSKTIHSQVAKIKECAYSCHILYDLNNDTLINCMKKCDKKYLHTEQ